MGATSTEFVGKIASSTGQLMTETYPILILLLGAFFGLLAFGLVTGAIKYGVRRVTRF